MLCQGLKLCFVSCFKFLKLLFSCVEMCKNLVSDLNFSTTEIKEELYFPVCFFKRQGT